ncbi:hypothetical protein [Nonomuraea sp. NPDC003201]
MRFITGIVLVLAAVGGCTSTPIKPVDPGNRFTSRPPVDLKSIGPWPGGGLGSSSYPVIG